LNTHQNTHSKNSTNPSKLLGVINQARNIHSDFIQTLKILLLKYKGTLKGLTRIKVNTSNRGISLYILLPVNMRIFTPSHMLNYHSDVVNISGYSFEIEIKNSKYYQIKKMRYA